jgi:hypothetical protein
MDAFFKLLFANAQEMRALSDSPRSFHKVMTGYGLSSVGRYLIPQLRPPVLSLSGTYLFGHCEEPGV